MSLIATFYSCDGRDCTEVFAVRNDQEHDEFQATWSESLTLDFCPKCRLKPENQAQLEAEAKVIGKYAEMVTI
jgi:hypothetical protein